MLRLIPPPIKTRLIHTTSYGMIISLVLGRRGDGHRSLLEYKVRLDSGRVQWSQARQLQSTLSNVQLLEEYDAELLDTKPALHLNQFPDAAVPDSEEERLASSMQSVKRKPYKRETKENCRARKIRKLAAMSETERFLYNLKRSSDRKTLYAAKKYRHEGKDVTFISNFRKMAKEEVAKSLTIYKELFKRGCSVADIDCPSVQLKLLRTDGAVQIAGEDGLGNTSESEQSCSDDSGDSRPIFDAIQED